MPNWAETRLGLQGLIRLVRFDSTFLRYFDRSTAGAMRSFGWALLLLPVYVWQIWLQIDSSVPSPLAFMTAKLVGVTYLWILFPFVILATARLTDNEDEAAGCIAIYNWGNVLWAVMSLPTALLITFGASNSYVAPIDLITFIASLAIEGFMLARCLRIAAWQAASLVVFDVVITQVLIIPLTTYLGCMP
jgi:hypothetical protein